MRDLTQSTEGLQHKTLKCCPLCGESSPESLTESVTHCPACGFDFSLLLLDQKPQVPPIKPAYVSRLAYGLIGTQIVFSGFFAVIFLLFASPLYFGMPQLIAGIQILAIVATGLFAIFLHRQKGVALIQIGLAIVGIISLPPGVCAIAAALAISPIKRWCVICGKRIRWGTYIECPHCHTVMHRWGSCRDKRLEAVTASVDPDAHPTQIEWTCPTCSKVMDPSHKGGTTSG